MNVLAVASVSLEILRSVLMRSGTLVLNFRTEGAPVPIETRQPSWLFSGAGGYVVFASAQRRRMGLFATSVLSLYAWPVGGMGIDSMAKVLARLARVASQMVTDLRRSWGQFRVG